jgi:hypothetical protein
MFPEQRELAVVAITILATVVLVGAGFGVGYFVGLKAAFASAMREARELTEAGWHLPRSLLLEQLEECQRSSRRAVRQSEQAVGLAEDHEPPVQSELLAAVRELAQTTRTLSGELHRARATGEVIEAAGGVAPPQDAGPSDSLPHAAQATLTPAEAKSDSKLTSVEMCTVVGSPEHLDDASSGLPNLRYPYDCYQQMAPWRANQPLPTPGETVRVRCHDISASGISFLWPVEPNFDRVVISIGADEQTIFMAAEVRIHRAVYLHNEVAQLVGCRFIKRLEEFATVPSGKAAAAAG